MARIFRRRGPDGKWLKVYYAWVPDPETGGTRRVSTKCTNPAAAQRRADQLELEALDPDSAAQAQATLNDAIDLLILDRESQAKGGKRSVETVEFYRKKGGLLLGAVPEALGRHEGDTVRLREVNGAVVDDYIILRRNDGAKDSTIQKELTTWRASMRLAKRRRLWKGDLEETFPKFGADYKPGERYLEPHEVLPLRAAFIRPTKHRGGSEGPERGHALWAVCAFMIATGAEWSAVWRARREDVVQDTTAWYVRVRGSKNKRRDDVNAIVFLAFAYLLDEALRFADGEHGLFLNHEGSFRHRLAEACERAGIAVRSPDGKGWARRPLSPTDLRRTHGKWLRLAGVTPGVIGVALRHADGRMAERVYARASAVELADVQRAELAQSCGLLMGSNPEKVSQNSADSTPPESGEE